jgi:hypothetical protein
MNKIIDSRCCFMSPFRVEKTLRFVLNLLKIIQHIGNKAVFDNMLDVTF